MDSLTLQADEILQKVLFTCSTYHMLAGEKDIIVLRAVKSIANTEKGK